MSDDDRHHRRRYIAVIAALLALLAAGVPVGLWLVASQSSASFADAEVLESNHLGAATLDIEVGTDEAVFEAENLAPGDDVSGQLELTNAGSLPLLYGVRARTGGGLLASWLRFDLWVSDTICSPENDAPLLASGVALTSTDTTLAAVGEAELSLAPGESATVCLGANLPLEAPNDVQGRRLDVELVVDAVHDIEAQS